MGARDTRARLLRRAAKADLQVPAPLADRLIAFLELLHRWNRKINLTGLEDLDEAVDRLLLEPMAAARHLPVHAGRLIDVGSGGGSPAIPLALVFPELALTMVEIKARKAAFLREAVRVLELPRVTVETARFEELAGKPDHHRAYGALSVRAVRVDAIAFRQFAELLAADGLALMFRGPGGADEPAPGGPLEWAGTYPLVPSLQSRVTVFRRVR